MQQKGIDLLPGWEVAYFIPPLQSVGIKVIYRQLACKFPERNPGQRHNTSDFTFSSDTLKKESGEKKWNYESFFVLFF